MDFFFSANRYLRYLLTAKTPHGVHSPFVFDFVNNLLRDPTPFYAFKALDKARESLIADKRLIEVVDYGSGGMDGKEKKAKIGKLATGQTLPLKYARLLFRMVNRFQPETILEMGTSVGITTLHLAAANTKAKVITLEGSPGTAAVAKGLFEKYNARSIEIRTGEFDTTMNEALKTLGKLDFLFVDGNHRYDPTMSYFQKALPFCHPSSVFVFDDIHWSREMEKAWEEIRSHPKVTLSIDLYRMGILFFHEGRRPEHFTLKY